MQFESAAGRAIGGGRSGVALDVRLEAARSRQATPARTLVGSVASESAFKQLAPGRRVLHLATHGFFLGDECDTPPAARHARRGRARHQCCPRLCRARAQFRRRQAGASENPLLLSGLALAGANRRAAAGPDEDDGILTAEEVAGLDLTGRGLGGALGVRNRASGLVRVGEGVLGLRRAFQTAGARTVIMSLWSVEDRATRQWMRALYHGAASSGGLDTADSVQAGRAHRPLSAGAPPASRATRSSGPGFAAAGDWR